MCLIVSVQYVGIVMASRLVRNESLSSEYISSELSCGESSDRRERGNKPGGDALSGELRGPAAGSAAAGAFFRVTDRVSHERRARPHWKRARGNFVPLARSRRAIRRQNSGPSKVSSISIRVQCWRPRGKYVIARLISRPTRRP